MAKVPSEKSSDQTVISETIREHCGGLKGKENKLVSFVSGAEEQ
jgi:hypothetical protein